MKKNKVLGILLVAIIGIFCWSYCTSSGEKIRLEHKLKKIANCKVTIQMLDKKNSHIYIHFKDGDRQNPYHCKVVLDALTDYMNNHRNSFLCGARIDIVFSVTNLQTCFYNYKEETIFNGFYVMETSDIFDYSVSEFFECFPELQYVEISCVENFEDAGVEYLFNPQKLEIKHINQNESEIFKEKFAARFPDCELVIDHIYTEN